MEDKLLLIGSNEPLAWLFVACAALAALAVGRAGAAGASVMLAAGIVGWFRRLRAKGKPGAPSTHPSPPGGPRPEPNLMLIRWRQSYECGHPVIDTQHRELFDMGNELINAVLDGKPKAGIEYLLHELVEHVRDHFTSEEAVLRRTRYPHIEEHQALHRGLLQHAKDLEERCRKGVLPMSELVGFVAYDVIAAHIIHDDLKFALRSR